MRKKLTLGDILIVVILFFVAGRWLVKEIRTSETEKKIVVSCDGKDYYFSFGQKREEVFNNVKVLIDEDGILVVDSSCHNKICVKTGKISKVGQIIVCAPNKVVIKIVSSKNPSRVDSLGY